MSTYTERAWNVSDEDEIKRIREYIAALKAELVRVRSLDPTEFWWDEIARIQRLIQALLDKGGPVWPPEVISQIDELSQQQDALIDERDYLLAWRAQLVAGDAANLRQARWLLEQAHLHLDFRLEQAYPAQFAALIEGYHTGPPNVPYGGSIYDWYERVGFGGPPWTWWHVWNFYYTLGIPADPAWDSGAGWRGELIWTPEISQNGWYPLGALVAYTVPAFAPATIEELIAQRDYWAAYEFDYSEIEAMVAEASIPDPNIAVIDAQVADLNSQIDALEEEMSDIIRSTEPGSGLSAAEIDRLEALVVERATAMQRYREAREPKRTWYDITGDVVWSRTSFTQTAKTGPGSFEITLRGDHPEFKGGEEIHFEIDDLRTFGGWTTTVERGYFFDDAIEPMTVLRGTDYNILFDRLAVRNYPGEFTAHADTKMMMGPYRRWADFPQGTLDSEMIETVFSQYLLPDLPLGFDFSTGVDTIDTPAPVSPWAMPEAGATLRRFMQSISQITSGVWNIDAYMVLQYHDRGVPNGPKMLDGTTPIAITDGLGGISSANLVVKADIGSMVNDVIVWGTLARTVEGEIVSWHEYGDIKFWERYYLGLIERAQAALTRLYAIRPSKRTAKQRNRIEVLKARIVAYKAALEYARAREWDPLSGEPRPDDPIVNSIETWGRWQQGEFREDLHHTDWIRRRAHSILTRFDEPIITATATIWDPGFQAGMVVPVRSSEHGLDANLVIRQMRVTFSVAKEPISDRYYAVPRYDLDMGLEPEAPWNIYDYLPYPGENTPGLGGDKA